MQITSTQILTAICTQLQVTPSELSQKKVRRQALKIVEAKQIAAYMLLKYTRSTVRQVSIMLGYANLTNAFKMRKRIIRIATVDKDLRQKLIDLETAIGL